jgi:hypothetical protein
MTSGDDDRAAWTNIERDAWLADLRQELYERGYDSADVETLIGMALERFDSAPVRDFVPLLVSRWVQRTLRER